MRYRNRKVAVSIFAIYCLLVYLCFAAETSEGVVHGTYFAMYVSDDFLALAIDSRRTEETSSGERSTVDNQCKIELLSDHDVFIAEGIISNNDARAPRFDGFMTASTSYQRAAGSLKNAADAWAAELAPPFAALYPFYPNLFDQRPNGEVVVGYFLGIDTDGKLAAFSATVLHSKAANSFSVTTKLVAKNTYTLPGPEEVVTEFFRGQTTRANIAQTQLHQEAVGKSPVDEKAITLKHLVQAIPAWANDPGSGGDIAVLTMERGKKWRWFHRPGFCPKN
jgi:hypothetical protein